MLQIKQSQRDATMHQPTGGEDTSVPLHLTQGKSSSFSPSCKYILTLPRVINQYVYLTMHSFTVICRSSVGTLILIYLTLRVRQSGDNSFNHM